MDDPRWTAYVLGELADTDRAELERILESTPDARAYVASLREAIGMLETELRAQPTPPALDDLQRKRIEKAAAQPAVTTKPSRRALWIAAGSAAAAGVLAIGIAFRGSADSADNAERSRAIVNEAPAENMLAQEKTTDRLQLQLQEGTGKTKNQELGRWKQPVTTTPAINGGYFGGKANPGPGLDGNLPAHNTESYSKIDDNPFRKTTQDPLSTFSVDVDTASYANVRRYLDSGQRPPKDAVRIEEMINYFKYSYPAPEGNEPFSINAEVGPSPWNAKHQLVRIGLQAPTIPDSQVPPRNLTFLIDTSGSMQSPNKLPLLKQSLGMLVENLRPQDKVSIVVYAGAAGLVLPPTSDRQAIKSALDRLEAGGSTNGGAGIQLAYATARKSLIKGGINRVILCSDGDMNVGITSEGDLTRLIEGEREAGVFLTVLGFGMGNYKDSHMEKLADRGNGNYAYIDSALEARKVLVKEAGSTLVTVAKDVKLQIEFNPAVVAGYRLVGYENRVLANQDFNDDKKDAGEVGAGHAVTALYEIVPAGVEVPSAGKVDDLKYQAPTAPTANGNEMLTVKIRYKAPDGNTSKLLSRAVATNAARAELASTSIDFRWATSMAAFGMLLRDSPYRGNLTWQQVQALADGAVGQDPDGYRKQATALIDRASKLAPAVP